MDNKNTLKYGSLVSSLILLLMFSFAGCTDRNKLANVDLQDIIEPEADISGEQEINICVGSMITPKEGYAYYKALLDYIGEYLKMRVNFIERESYSEVNSLLGEGKIDMAFICGGPYTEGHDKFGLELIAAPQVDGKTVYNSYIIVHKGSLIEHFEDLKGKTFVFADPISNSGRNYPVYLLKQIGEAPETFFKEYIYSYAHDISIRAVAEGIADAGAVDSLVWNYMERTGSPFTRNTRIIKVSPAFGIPPVVVRPTLKKDLKEMLRQILLDAHQNEKGKKILKKMFIDKFVPVDDSNYASIREIKHYLQNK